MLFFLIRVDMKCQTHHSAKWDGSGGVVVNSNEVDEEGGPAHHGWDQEGSDEHLFNPSSACEIKIEIMECLNQSNSLCPVIQLQAEMKDRCCKIYLLALRTNSHQSSR